MLNSLPQKRPRTRIATANDRLDALAGLWLTDLARAIHGLHVWRSSVRVYPVRPQGVVHVEHDHFGEDGPLPPEDLYCVAVCLGLSGGSSSSARSTAATVTMRP